jgi:hypothetical protein
MAEWLGHLIANWPVWAVLLTLILVGIAWMVYELTTTEGSLWPMRRREWWQDKIKNQQKNQHKQKKG